MRDGAAGAGGATVPASPASAAAAARWRRPGRRHSSASPLTASVLILRGSLFGIVPLAAVAGGGADGETLAAGGGLLFWFSGGNTTRGPPDLELTSTGVSSRDTSFSPPSPDSMRSGVLAAPHRTGAGTTLVGLLSALMIGGSPRAGRTDIGAIGKGSPGPDHGQRQHGGDRHQAAGALLRRGLFLIVSP